MDFAGSDVEEPAEDGSYQPDGHNRPDGRGGFQHWQTNRSRAPASTKIVVAGGFGVGKTTFVGAVSEITPLTTEAVMTRASEDIDDLGSTPAKTTTTVAMDFGRITLDQELVLYLFGTPGQHRFWFMWDDLVRGAIGAVVLADTRRLADSFPALDYFEASGLPYMVAVNRFEGTTEYAEEDVREALAVPGHIPVLICDARKRRSVIEVLLVVTTQALTARGGCPVPGARWSPTGLTGDGAVSSSE